MVKSDRIEQPGTDVLTPEPLDKKYRPRSFKQFLGNAATVTSLQSVLAKPHRPHTMLFIGPSGCGKTSLARIAAQELGCRGRDLHEMNNANFRGVDHARDLISKSSLSPWDEVSFYLLDEAHKLTNDAQNTLLKLLEEPPPHAYFALCTTDPDKLIATVKNRCVVFAVHALPTRTIQNQLLDVCEKEGCPDAQPTDRVVGEISRVCGGSMRKALNLLDQVIDIRDEGEALDALVDAAGDEYQVLELCQALVKGNRWPYIQGVLKGLVATDVESVRYAILGYFNTVMLTGDTGRAHRIARYFLPSMMYTGKAGLTMACYNATIEFERDRIQ